MRKKEERIVFEHQSMEIWKQQAHPSKRKYIIVWFFSIRKKKKSVRTKESKDI